MEQDKWVSEYVPRITSGITEQVFIKWKRNNKGVKASLKDYIEWVTSKGSICPNMLFDKLLWLLAYKVRRCYLDADKDCVVLFVGIEGSGKSRLAIKFSSIISPSFKLDLICTGSEHYNKALNLLHKGDCLQIDEGVLLAFNRKTMAKDNVNFVQDMQLIRQDNLGISICIPSITNIDSYVKNHRAEYVIQMQKGTFKYQALTKTIFKEKNKDDKVIWKSSWKGESYSSLLPTLNDITEEGYLSRKSDYWEQRKKTRIEETKIPEWIILAQRMKALGHSVIDISKIVDKGWHTVDKAIKNGTCASVIAAQANNSNIALGARCAQTPRQLKE